MSADSTPSNTGTLAEQLRQKRKADEQEVESIWDEHEANLKQLLKRELQEIEEDMQSVRSLTRQQLRRSVLPLSILWGVALLAVVIAAGSAWYAHHQMNEIEKHRATLSKVPKLHLRTCDNQTCVAVKPKLGKFGTKQKTYMIIQQ